MPADYVTPDESSARVEELEREVTELKERIAHLEAHATGALGTLVGKATKAVKATNPKR